MNNGWTDEFHRLLKEDCMGMKMELARSLMDSLLGRLYVATWAILYKRASVYTSQLRYRPNKSN